MTMLPPAEADRRFGYHPPRDDTTRIAHETLRARARAFAETLDELVPDSREKAVALTHVEDAMMWGNAGIARGPVPPPVRAPGGGAAPSPTPRRGAVNDPDDLGLTPRRRVV